MDNTLMKLSYEIFFNELAKITDRAQQQMQVCQKSILFGILEIEFVYRLGVKF